MSYRARASAGSEAMFEIVLIVETQLRQIAVALFEIALVVAH